MVVLWHRWRCTLTLQEIHKKQHRNFSKNPSVQKNYEKCVCRWPCVCAVRVDILRTRIVPIFDSCHFCARNVPNWISDWPRIVARQNEVRPPYKPPKIRNTINWSMVRASWLRSVYTHMGLSLSITHTAAWPLFSRAHIRPATVADLNAYANRAGLSFQAQSHSQSQSPSSARSQFHWHSNPLETLVWAAKNEQQRQQVLVRLTVDAIKILWPHKLLRVRS